MKILQLVTKRQYRGAEVFAANLSTELLNLGHEIIFVGLYKNDSNILEVADAENLDLSSEKTGAFSPILVNSIVRLVNKVHPDVIQCNGSDTLKYMVAASFFTSRIPLVYRNISIISEWLSNTPKKMLYRKIFDRIDHVSCVGEEAKEDFLNTFNYPKHQTSVIRRGIPIKEVSKFARHNLKEELGLNESAKIVMHVGNFSPEKNHIFLLDTFSELKVEDSDIKLICVGDGILFEEIKTEIEKRNLDSSIFLLGFRKDIPELLSQADCFVLVSKVEGVPGVILEAAAQRKPSIATNVGGVFEVLKHEKTGYIIENFNKDQFKEKLLLLMSNANLREEMGDKAFDLVQQEFNPVKNALHFESLYKRLVLNIS